MMIEKVFYVGTHEYSYHSGSPAEVIGIKMITPEGLDPRPCFHLRYSNGDEDFSPISETQNYRLISESDAAVAK